MPYHLGGHKAKLKVEEKRSFGLKERLILAAGGLFFTIVGMYSEMHGPLVWSNRYSQPVYAATLLSIGVPVLLCSLIPSAWLEHVAARILRRN